MNQPTQTTNREVILRGALDDCDGYRCECEDRILEAIDEVCAPDIENVDAHSRKEIHEAIALKLAQALANVRSLRKCLIEAQKERNQ